MAKLSKAKLRQLDAMSPSDRAFALFTAVEKARSAAIAEMRDKGQEIDYDEAHQAALAVWNQWAQPLLEEREELEEAGEWEHFFDEPIGTIQNEATHDFHRRADLNANSITFFCYNRSGKLDSPKTTIFCKKIEFNGFSFPGDTSFNSTVFDGNSNFNNTEFKGYAHFVDVTYNGFAYFNRASFANYTLFNNAKFNGHTSYSKTTFSGKVHFRNTKFNKVIEFNYSSFVGEANFFRSNFKEVASFHLSVFEQTTYLHHVKFTGTAYFRGATFNGDSNFEQTDFSSSADFSDAKFSLGSNWTAINAVRAFNMAGARFETQVPQFTQAHFTESPRVDNIEFPIPNRGSKTMPSPTANKGWKEKLRFWRWFSANPGKLIDKDDIAAFTALRRIAKQGEDHETEREAFKGEMRTQRIAGDHGLPYRLFSWAYDLFADFGGSFLRPFLLWAALTIASAFIYAGAATSPIYKTEQATCDCPAVHALQLSARNALLFATAGQRPFVTKSLDCLYGKEPKEQTVQNPTRTGPPLWLGLFGTVQTLLSAILIFFILLALRNRFKI